MPVASLWLHMPQEVSTSNMSLSDIWNPLGPQRQPYTAGVIITPPQQIHIDNRGQPAYWRLMAYRLQLDCQLCHGYNAQGAVPRRHIYLHWDDSYTAIFYMSIFQHLYNQLMIEKGIKKSCDYCSPPGSSPSLPTSWNSWCFGCLKLISPYCRIYASVNWVSIGLDNGLSPIRHQCCVIVNWSLRYKLLQNITLFICENPMQNIVCEMVAILSRRGWVNRHEPKKYGLSATYSSIFHI